MTRLELNPEGNFDNWNYAKLNELYTEKFSDTIGQELLFENHAVRLWTIYLEPYERIPFRRLVNDMSWICSNGGLALLRNANGKIDLLRFNVGDIDFWELKKNEIVADLENIGEEPLLIKVLEYKSESLDLLIHKVETSHFIKDIQFSIN